MDNYMKELLQCVVHYYDVAGDYLHRLMGYLDAQADFKPILQIFPGGADEPTKKEDEQREIEQSEGVIEFTEKEITLMPKKMQGILRIHRKSCRWRIHKCGKNSSTIEIRFRADGYNLSASGKTLEIARKRMLEKLRAAKPTLIASKKQSTEPKIPQTFNAFAQFFFREYRENKVAAKTYQNDSNRYKRYLLPFFGEEPLKKITPYDCKRLLAPLEEAEKFKTHDEIFSLLSLIFKSAIAHDVIEKNPLRTLERIAYKQETSVALTKDEEIELLSKTHKEPIFELALALALYTGLRPNEIETARIDGEFIVAVNSKQKKKIRVKNGQNIVEHKKIYICDKLRAYLQNGLPALPGIQSIRRRMKKALPSHLLKDLRKTFNSRCKELGVSTHAREYFMGHSLGKVDRTYTSFSDEYLLKEGKKLNEW